jgi:hypothetical protein
VLGANDLGMHCMDREYSVFSILPPYNVIRAQVVRRESSGPRLLDASEVDVRYDAVADPTGSINSTSVGKTDFWDHALELFGADLPPGAGFQGLFMPADAPAPGPQPFAFHAGAHWWAAEGIPITPLDDARAMNPYPLLRLSARSKSSGATLAHLDVVVPVAIETECRTCHRTGGSGSTRPGIPWSDATDLEVQAKQNVLRLHDAMRGTDLYGAQPVLCASCHYSPALDLAGTGPQGAQQYVPWFSRAIHAQHDFLPGSAADGCYQCHPGAVTQCARGPMVTAGLECRDCHGDMAAVAGETPLAPGGSLDGVTDGEQRRAWTDLPRCQSCHTGDALTHLSGAGYVPSPDGIRLLQAWKVGDAAASAIASPLSRFAENGDTLYRFSKGHGGVLCQGCHGSTHAEWPVQSPAANDNLAAVSLQGHAGALRECGVCHAEGSLSLTLGGPHGMHNVGDARWADGGHGEFYENNANRCRACHGANLEGTALSRAAVNRTYRVEDRTVTILQGEAVACTRCHEWPVD